MGCVTNDVKGYTARPITEMAGSVREIRVAIKQRQGISESRPENLF